MAAIHEQTPGRTEGSPIEDMEFIERARAVFDDYSSTMRSVVPNFGHRVSLKDFDGVEWIVDVFRADEDEDIYAIGLGRVEDRYLEPERKAYLSKTPFDSMSIGLHFYEPEQILDFVEGKIKELLGPIKAAQALRSIGQ